MNADISHETRFSLTDPGELISTVPYVLGIRPIDSIVVVGLNDNDGLTVNMVMRADLSERSDYGTLAVHLSIPLVTNESAGAVLIIVGGLGPDPARSLPHVGLVSQCRSELARSGVPVLHRLWAARTTTGARWRCYDDRQREGTVPDSHDSPVARACAAAGTVLYNRREDLAATLAPVAKDVLARRADLFRAACLSVEDSSTTGLAGLQLVETWVDRVAAGILPQSEEDSVKLAIALTDHAVRDACLDLGSPARNAAGERLWTTLIRNTPAPERAEAASMLALAAYGRGDGVLVSIATECALRADPSHRLSGLIDSARSIGLSPTPLRRAAVNAAVFVRSALAATAEEGPER
jgi:hypothetical protein